MVSLVIGGARSGKSRFAQSLGESTTRAVYVATLRAEDEEMVARVAQHRRDRPPHWVTLEAPLDIAGAVERSVDCDFLLIDCLTLWLSNLYWEHRHDSGPFIESSALGQMRRIAAVSTPGHVVLVTNEVGCGIVPDSPVGRLFRDLQGRVNQEAARLADEVFHMVAGIPVVIKQGRR